MEFKPQLFTKSEIKFWIYYLIIGIFLTITFKILLNIPIIATVRGFYGFVYMFFIPGFLLLRAVNPYKRYEELAYIGYPFGITLTIVMSTISTSFALFYFHE